MSNGTECSHLQQLGTDFWEGKITPDEFKLRLAGLTVAIKDFRVIESLASAIKNIVPRI